MDKLQTKQELLAKLNALTSVPDDNNIFLKEKVKKALLKSPELLYALHNVDLEQTELFNEDGTINYDGDWTMYYGREGNIHPHFFLPNTQPYNTMNHLCFKTEFTDIPKYNQIMCYMQVTFLVMVNVDDVIDPLTGITRHDLIDSIIRERFNWSNIFGAHCNVVSDKESFTDSNYIIRTIVVEQETTNNITGTRNGKRMVINKQPWTS